MKAYSAINPENSIDNPVFVSVRYGDDTPSYYAIDPEFLAWQADEWSCQNAIVEIIPGDDMLAMIEKGAWLGIKEATVSGVCSAWGHAKVSS